MPLGSRSALYLYFWHPFIHLLVYINTRAHTQVSWTIPFWNILACFDHIPWCSARSGHFIVQLLDPLLWISLALGISPYIPVIFKPAYVNPRSGMSLGLGPRGNGHGTNFLPFLPLFLYNKLSTTLFSPTTNFHCYRKACQLPKVLCARGQPALPGSESHRCRKD